MSHPRKDSEAKSDSNSPLSRHSINVKIPSAGPTATTFDGNTNRRTSDADARRKSSAADTTNNAQKSGTPDTKSASPPFSRGFRHGMQDLLLQTAASVIERAWIACRDNQMFRLLKHSVCAAENSLSQEIMRKVCPKEASFFNDKSIQVKVRFRFGGSEFPPKIFFKVFLHSKGKGVKYYSGKKYIKPASEAAEDSLRLMGSRLFYDHMIQDSMVYYDKGVADEEDIITLKDYMQYISTLDEMPAHMGGKENYWRKLTLDDLPRHTIFYDVVDYAYNGKMTGRLREEITMLAARPITQEIQLQQLRAIAMRRPPLVSEPTALPPSQRGGPATRSTTRRSRQARLRAQKMRRAYFDKNESHELAEGGHRPGDTDYLQQYHLGEEEEGDEEGEEEVEEWEREASQLYEWTQDLSFNDEILESPLLIPT